MGALQRLLPGRTWLYGSGLAVASWALLSVLLGATALLCAALLADVAASRGGIVLTGQELLEREPDPHRGLRVSTPVNLAPGGLYRLENLGIRAAALRYRGSPLGDAMDRVARRSTLLQSNLPSLLLLVLAAATLMFARSAAAARMERAGGKLALERAATLRNSVHRQALRLTPGDLDGSGQRRAAKLFGDDITAITQALFVWASHIPREVAAALVLVPILFVIDPRLAAQCLVPLCIAGWMYAYAKHGVQALQADAEVRAGGAVSRLSEGLRKSRLVRGYGMEAYEAAQFESHLQRLMREAGAGRRRTNGRIWAARACSLLSVALIVFFVGTRVMNPEFGVSFAAGVLMLSCLVRIGLIGAAVDRARQGARVINDRGRGIQEYLAAVPEVGQAVGAKFLQPVSKSIIFESVGYKVGGRDVLKDLDLRIAARTSTAIVSADPTSARAVAFLLPRFTEPHSGRVLFDSEDTAWGTLESIRAETVFVSGDGTFFNGTVLQNLTCGDSRFSVQDATEASKVTHAHNFVVKLPQGYETVIGEHGHALDAGQAFRLSLARAMLRNPSVMIIEEPDAPFDEDTKALLDDAYQRVMRNRTIVFLPHRLSTVRRCDQVVLLHEGRVTAAGSHETLVKQSDLYRHWEYMAFNALRPRERTAAAG